MIDHVLTSNIWKVISIMGQSLGKWRFFAEVTNGLISRLEFQSLYKWFLSDIRLSQSDCCNDISFIDDTVRGYVPSSTPMTLCLDISKCELNGVYNSPIFNLNFPNQIISYYTLLLKHFVTTTLFVRNVQNFHHSIHLLNLENFLETVHQFWDSNPSRHQI